MLPCSAAAGARVAGAHSGYQAEAEHARDTLLSLPRRPFAKTLSEREWLRGVGRMWDLIRRSTLLADYNRTAQTLHCFA